MIFTGMIITMNALHESLNDQTPSDYYKKSNRQYVEHPYRANYDHNYLVRQVRHSGEIKFMGQNVLNNKITCWSACRA